MIAVVAVGSAFLARNWNTVLPALLQMSPKYWIPSLISALAAMACATQSWRVVLNGLGPRVRLRRSAPVFLVGQLGKYVPGSVWAYVLQVELGRRVGVARARVATATLAASLIAVVATLMMSLLAVPAMSKEIPTFDCCRGLICSSPSAWRCCIRAFSERWWAGVCACSESRTLFLC